MTDGKDHTAPRHVEPAEKPAESLASRVLGVLASRAGRPGGHPDHALLSAFCETVRRIGAESQDEALALMRAARVSDELIADVYIPAAARFLGEEWCADNSSFADVTIGSSRLQSMLRGLSDRMTPAGARSARAASALVIVPDGEYHTLGAMSVVGLLRRAGMSVRLSTGDSLGTLLEIAESHSFDVVFITAPHSEKLELLGKLIQKLRSALEEGTPLVVGGASLALLSEHELKARTGADHATNDLDEALRLCGLTVSLQGAGRRQARG